MESTENISLYRNKKAYATKGTSKHVNEYDVLSDNTIEDGTRTITIKPSDKTEHLRLCSDLADEIVKRLGESDNKLLKTMFFDTLRDYRDRDVEDMYKMVVLKEAPVKYREGCFKLIIGDGRKKNHHEIMLID